MHLLFVSKLEGVQERNDGFDQLDVVDTNHRRACRLPYSTSSDSYHQGTKHTLDLLRIKLDRALLDPLSQIIERLNSDTRTLLRIHTLRNDRFHLRLSLFPLCPLHGFGFFAPYSLFTVQLTKEEPILTHTLPFRNEFFERGNRLVLPKSFTSSPRAACSRRLRHPSSDPFTAGLR